jgi:DNA-binding GntR family transcriptional regulator
LGAESAQRGPNRKAKVGTSAADRILELLADHDGEMVRDQRSLAAMLDCSKTQVCRALAQLAAGGRVRVVADRSGTRVTQLAA